MQIIRLSSIDILAMKKLLASTILISALSLTECMTHPTLSQEQRPKHWGTVLSDAHNFYQISPDVFRSEQPSTELIPLIKQYQIDTVINLRARNADATILKDQPFNLVHIPMNTWAIDRNDLLTAMQSIQTAKQHNQKVLIHCYHGSDRTGATIAMYRIVFEKWAIEDAKNEMKQGGYGYHLLWKNIENLFRPENVKWIQQQLSNPSS